MSDKKHSFHGPMTGDSSLSREVAVRQEVAPLAPAHLQEVRQRSRLRPAGAAEEGGGAQFVLHALRRWWKLALPAGLLLAAIGGAVTYLLFVPQYEAIALLEIEERPQYIAFPEPRAEGRTKQYFLTQMQLIQSAWVMGPVVQQANVAKQAEIAKEPDPTAYLSKNVKVSALGESNVFKITYKCPDPDRAAAVVAAVTEEYLKLRNQNEATQNQIIIDRLTKEMERRTVDVTALREQVRKLTKETTGKDPFLAQPDPEPISKHPLAEVQARLVTVQVERAMLDAKIKAAEEEMQSLSDTISAKPSQAGGKADKLPLTGLEVALRDTMVDKTIRENLEVKQQEASLLARQAMLQQIAKVAARGEKDPRYAALQSELAGDEQRLDKLRKEMRAQIEKEAELSVLATRTQTDASLLAKRGEEVSRMRCDLRGYEIAEKNLRATFEKQVGSVQTASGSHLDLVLKKDELAQAQKVLDRISERQLQLQTEQGAPPRIILRQPALRPNAPVEASPYKNMSLAILAGLCVPFGLAVGGERLVRRISDSRDIEQQLQMTVVGEIARLPARTVVANRSNEAGIREGLRMFEESIESLRNTLTLSEDLQNMRILAITSAANHEGKTSVAAQLAMSLAHATGEPTLLIDGDMRSPDLHRVFDVRQEPGLAEVLGGECDLEGAIVASQAEHLDVLPAGRLVVSPHRLLGNGTWKSLLAEVPSTYRYVIIDTPPVLAASEALVLAKAADATLLCVMRDVSRTDQVRKVAERLQAAGGHPVGMVLSGVPAKQYAYRYGTYPSAPAPLESN